jgi:hypothetical protein
MCVIILYLAKGLEFININRKASCEVHFQFSNSGVQYIAAGNAFYQINVSQFLLLEIYIIVLYFIRTSMEAKCISCFKQTYRILCFNW